MSIFSGDQAFGLIEHILDEVKDCESVSDGTQHRIAIWCEDEVALLVDGSAQVRELLL